jgi:NADPH2:quinone reductase
MRARHPSWFKEDLERLFGLLATGAIRPRVADRISFDEVTEAHRRLEAGDLLGKLVLCPKLPPRHERESAKRVEAHSTISAQEMHPPQGAAAKEPVQQ